MERNFSSSNGCLSAPGKPFELPEEARKLLCYTQRGHLYVLKGEEMSAWSLAYQELLRRNRKPFRLVSKNSHEIKLRYEQADGARSQQESRYNTSLRQIEVIKLIKDAVQARASDIHIIIESQRALVRFRVDGSLHTQNELGSEDGSDLCATIYQTMCDVAEPVFNPHRSQDARLDLASVSGLNLYGGRVATRPTDSGLLMVIRLLYDRIGDSVDLEGLGYLPEQVKMLEQMGENRFGINILSGPTGSGKSTTLEVVLKNIIAGSHGNSHILTIEDPPEYRIDGAVQTPILCDKEDDNSVSLEWAHSIANTMRLDPDVLMCGEVRDQSSATATFRAAMTGHGVWTTVHANDALSVLTRLEEIGISQGLMLDASLVTGLVNQALVRKLCPQCKITYREGASLIPSLQRERIAAFCAPETMCLRGSGCSNCKEKGILGRTVVAECIIPTIELFETYRSSGKYGARRHWLEKMNGKSKFRVLAEKINQGIVDPRDGEADLGWLRAD